MLEYIVDSSVRHRWLILLAIAALAAFGAFNCTRLTIDAVPDITNVQVQINTEAPGFSPLEAEQRITFAVETAMAGLPRLDYTRSISRYGLSQVTVVFEDGTDIYFARQRVAERLQEARSLLPPGLEPGLSERPHDGGVDPSLEITRDVCDGLASAEGRVLRRFDHVAAELAHGDLERRSRAKRRLLEQQRDVLSSQRLLVRPTGGARQFQVGRERQARAQF